MSPHNRAKTLQLRAFDNELLLKQAQWLGRLLARTGVARVRNRCPNKLITIRWRREIMWHTPRAFEVAWWDWASCSAQSPFDRSWGLIRGRESTASRKHTLAAME
jgi:hypothetical protein